MLRYWKTYALILFLLMVLTVPESYMSTNSDHPHADQITAEIEKVHNYESSKLTTDPAPSEAQQILGLSVQKGKNGSFALHMPDQYEPRLDTHSHFPLQQDGWIAKRWSETHYPDASSKQGYYQTGLLLIDPHQPDNIRQVRLWDVRTKSSMPSFWLSDPLMGYIDESRFAFLEAIQIDDHLHFNISTIDVNTEQIITLFPQFHTLQEDEEDYFFPPVRSTTNPKRFLLNTWKGHIWIIDIAKEAITKIEGSFPSYGDPGSKPIRSLVYPSNRLHRFVYEDEEHFRLYRNDGTLLYTVGKSSLGKADSPSFYWSPDDAYTYVKYTKDEKHPFHLYSDDGAYTVHADAILFFDHNGKFVTQIEAQNGQKIDVHGWVGNSSEIVIEHYELAPLEHEFAYAEKTNSRYHLYEMEKERVTPLTMKQAYTDGTNWVHVTKPNTYFKPHDLYIDRRRNIIWKTPDSWIHLANYHFVEPIYSQIMSAYTYTDEHAQLTVYALNRMRQSWDVLWSHDHTELQPLNVELFDNWLLFHYQDERRKSISLSMRNLETDWLADLKQSLAKLPPIFVESQQKPDSERFFLPTKPTPEQGYWKSAQETRYGTVTLQSVSDWTRLEDYGYTKRMQGEFEVVYKDLDGHEQIITRWDNLVLREDVQDWSWRIFAYDNFDLVLLQPMQQQYYTHMQPEREIYAFAVTKQQQAFPLSFAYAAEDHVQTSSKLVIQGDLPIAKESNTLTLYSPLPAMYQLQLEPNLEQGILKVVQAEEYGTVYQKGRQLAEEQARMLEKLLLYDVGENVSIEKEAYLELQSMLTEKAKESDSYKYWMDNRGKFERAFYWGVSDLRWNEDSRHLRFTFAANVLYAVGQDARMEICMVKERDSWKIADFGSLHIEGPDEDRFIPGVSIIAEPCCCTQE